MVWKEDIVGESFFTFVQARALLGLITPPFGKKVKKISRTRYAFTLLGDLSFSDRSMGYMWERIVDFTVVSRSFEKTTLSNVLGIDVFKDDYDDLFTIDVIPPENDAVVPVDHTLKLNPKKNMIIVHPYDTFAPGHDAILIVGKKKNKFEKLHFYFQMKVGMPHKRLEDVMASLICFNVLHYLISSNNLNDLHMVVYIWNLQPVDKAAMQSVVVAAAMKKAMNIILTGKSTTFIPESFEQQVKVYTENHWDNIHLVSKNKLKDWLSPSFSPFPMLLAEIENGVEDV